ncbi:MAG: glycosyltransferase family 4 protein [Clostridium sp.]|uniref:glycosyltransferase family 4 protein n=1 Tax=Clostridium sp. TaxID=1506 RepID=UPI003D6D76B4
MGIRIGIDGLYIIPGEIAGTGSYLMNLIKGLQSVDNENEYFIFATKSNCESFNINNKNFKIVICDLDNTIRFNRVLYTSTKLPNIIKDNKLDVMFFPTYVRCIQNLKEIKTISNVHDIQYKHFKENFSFSKRVLFSFTYPLSFKKSDKNICISNFVKQDIIENFKNINPKDLKVIYNPIDFKKFEKNDNIAFHGFAEKLGLETNNYVLSVASLLPHKNIPTLINAFSIYKKRSGNTNTKLVLVGMRDKATNDLVKLIATNKIEDSVVIPGFVSDDELSLLYNNACVFVSPSLFEGFGMPPVEAMYRNIPVITTKCTSLPEVTMGEVIYYNNPTDADELAKVIEETLDKGFIYRDDINEVLVEKYSVENAATRYKKLFEETALGK